MTGDEAKEILFILGMLMTHDKAEICWCCEEDFGDLHGNVCNNITKYYNRIKANVET